jgi:hypothetical protein
VGSAWASACRGLEPEEAAAKEASYEGNPICHGLIFIILFFRICSQQEAEARMCQAFQLCFYFGRRRRGEGDGDGDFNYASLSDDDELQ